MRVQKYNEFLILEGDTPEDYMKASLENIKSRLDKMFVSEDEIEKIEDYNKYNLTLLNTPKISQYSPLNRDIKYKFADEDNQVYIFTINIYLKDALNDDKDKDYNVSDIKKAVIRFDKYDSSEELEITGQILSRTVDPEEITPDFLMNLKSEVDDGEAPVEADEEFEIQTEEQPVEETPPTDETEI